jgi:hypothetical protein
MNALAEVLETISRLAASAANEARGGNRHRVIAVAASIAFEFKKVRLEVAKLRKCSPRDIARAEQTVERAAARVGGVR